MFTDPNGRQYQRIYHYHIRKTGGTSINWAFLRLTGGDIDEVYNRLSRDLQVDEGGLKIVGWNRGLIEAGNYDYAFSHMPQHMFTLPPDTFTFTVLRDPVARILSHYKMLLQMRDTSPDHQAYIEEKYLIEDGFDGFLLNVPDDVLKRQLFMFSKDLNIDEALENLSKCDLVIDLDSFEEGIAELRRRTGHAIEYSHDRKAKVNFKPSEIELARLREMLEPEYRFLERARREVMREGSAIERAKIPADQASSAPNLNLRKPFSVPVAVVAYNRPGHTAQVLEGLKEYGVERLYLFSDAARSEKDAEGVAKVRELFNRVDWAETEVIERKENLGLKRSVVGAANYLFKNYDTMLLLEDDVVPLPTMFPFIEEGLRRYKDVPEIAGVSGFGPPLPEQFLEQYPYDAYFFHRMSSWAWATWKSRWQQYRPDLAALMKEVLFKRTNLTLGGSNVVDYTLAALKGKDIWTPNWILEMAMRDQLFVYPTRSHINNVGLDGTGMNSGKTDRYQTVRHDHTASRFPEELAIAQEVCGLFYKTHGNPLLNRGEVADGKSGSYPLKRWVVEQRSKPIETNNPVELIRGAMQKIAARDFTGALEQLDQLNGASDSMQNIHLMRALCYRSLGQVSKAKDAVEKELSLFPENKDATALQSAIVADLQNEAAPAQRSAHVAGSGNVAAAPLRSPSSSEVATDTPETVEGLMAQARREMDSGMLDVSFETIHRAKAKKMPVRGLDLQRAELFIKMERIDDAREAVREELRLFPEYDAAKKLANEIGANQFQGKVPNDPEFLVLLEKIRPYTMLTELRLYNLYRMAKQACIEDLPGNFVECGVAGGGATALLAHIARQYSRRPRKVYAFDTFDGMPEPSEKDRQIRSGITAEESGWGTGTCAAPIENVHRACRELGAEDLLVAVAGLFEDTLPQTRGEVGEIALLHADADWYESQLSIFNHLYGNLVQNGFVQVDDYGYWSGSREAVDKFQSTQGVFFTMQDIDGNGVWFRRP